MLWALLVREVVASVLLLLNTTEILTVKLRLITAACIDLPMCLYLKQKKVS